MRFIYFWINQAYAVNYIPHSGTPVKLPQFPGVVMIGRVAILFLLFILILPLLKEQTDPQKEKERSQILKLSAWAAAVAACAHLYGFLAGI